MRLPPMFAPFCRYWRLSDAQAKALWRALCDSRYSAPCAWRQQLSLFEGTHLGTAEHLIDEVSTPAVVVEVVESLIHERRLAPHVGRQIEECILRRTDREGRWKAEPAGSRPAVRA